MAKPRDKKTGKPTGIAGEEPAGRSGRSGGAHKGFEEAAQAPFEGAPVVLKGPVSSWIEQLEGEVLPRALSNDEQNAKAARAEEMRRIRSEAGKHRLKASKGERPAAEEAAGRSGRSTQKNARPAGEEPAGRPGRKSQGVSEKKSSRGTLIGGTSDPRQRAQAGLMPVSGLDISLEDAGNIASSGVTATVSALEALIETGDPNLKQWVPHRPDRPEKSEGGIPLKMVTDFKPAGDQPTAIADLVEGASGTGSTTTPRSCSASPARARPSPWPR